MHTKPMHAHKANAHDCVHYIGIICSCEFSHILYPQEVGLLGVTISPLFVASA